MFSKKSLNSMAMILSAGFFALPIVGHADDGWHIGASVGLSDVDEFGIDDDDTGFKLFGGYGFNEFLSLDAAFVDLGDLDEIPIGGGPLNEFEVDGFSLAAIGTYPITDIVSIYGKGGVYFWDADITGSIAGEFNNDNDSDLFFGAGIGFKFYEKFAVVGEWERYEINDFDVDLLSIGLTYSF